jgi:demethylmenaquinone methyltransferase/2-methoxy-6-polyprenyl-1,4-benzoquinol methylase
MVLTSNETDFGFEKVAEAEKSDRVKAVFDSVAPRYDLMNDLMSAGVHRLWKSTMLDWLNPQPGQTLLDVAGGTGDISFRFLERTQKRGPSGNAIVCDINHAMLRAGNDRNEAERERRNIQWVCGDAEQLPLPDRSVDAYTIAFGIRNVTHIDRALSEAKRVLRPGGRFMCLEFSRVVVAGLDDFYETYSFAAIPRIGKWVTGDEDAYRYLVESIRKFPDQKKFAKMIEDAGLQRCAYRNLSGGIAAMHSAWRI